jgi:hypothetical protein
MSENLTPSPKQQSIGKAKSFREMMREMQSEEEEHELPVPKMDTSAVTAKLNDSSRMPLWKRYLIQSGKVIIGLGLLGGVGWLFTKIFKKLKLF